MSNMTAFFSAFLGAISQWLGSEPIIYLFGLTLLVGLCRGVKILLAS